MRRLLRRLLRSATPSAPPRPPALSWLRSYGINTVIDVGANEGQFMRDVYHAIPTAIVYGFEPLKEAFNSLSEFTAERPNVKVWQCALGNNTGHAQIMQAKRQGHADYSELSSLLPMSDEGLKTHEVEEFVPEVIEVRRLDDVVQEEKLQLEKELLVKIDVQGFENRVIEGGRKTIGQSGVVIVEGSFAGIYKGQATFDNIYRQLFSLGFRYAGNIHRSTLLARDGLELEIDAVFARSDG